MKKILKILGAIGLGVAAVAAAALAVKGLFNFDIIGKLLGYSVVAKVVYGLIGIAGLYALLKLFRVFKKK